MSYFVFVKKLKFWVNNGLLMNKKILLLSFALVALQVNNSLYAQILNRLGSRIEQKLKDRANRKVDQTIDKGIDKAENEVDGATRSNNRRNNGQSKNEEEYSEDRTSSGGSKNSSLKVDSKFDFVPGEKIVLFEDFSKDNIGDFPDKWNTNGSGEVVTLSNAEGRYLESRKEVVFYPEWIKSLPENFTLECDVIASDNYNFYSDGFAIAMTSAKNIGKDWRAYGKYGNGGDNESLVEIMIDPTNAGGQQGESIFIAKDKGKQILRNQIDQSQFATKTGKTKVHVAIWRQKQRVRVYLNDKKIWDIPRAIESGVAMNSIFFRNNGASKDEDAMYVGNIRVAVGAPDTRNKLITEGKFSTSGIMFDPNSDKIKPESYGTVKEIANVLSENADVRVKIIGHTDSDGDDAKNMELSNKRALAVKTMLIKDFHIDASRMESEGRGESQPAVKNDSPENKAQNRRVEFVKL